MFDFLADFQKKRGVKLETVAISNEDTLFGTDSAKTQRALAQKYGYRIVTEFAYRANSTSLTAEVQKLKAANPDWRFPTLYQSDAILFHADVQGARLEPEDHPRPGLGHIDPKFIEAHREGLRGISLALALRAGSGREDLRWRRRLNPGYKARSGRTSTTCRLARSPGIVTLVDALNRAGSTEPEATARLSPRLISRPLISGVPWTGVRFDETGQNVGARAIIVQLQGGKYWTVWPFEVAAREVLYPIPRWSDRK